MEWEPIPVDDPVLCFDLILNNKINLINCRNSTEFVYCGKSNLDGLEFKLIQKHYGNQFESISQYSNDAIENEYNFTIHRYDSVIPAGIETVIGINVSDAAETRGFIIRIGSDRNELMESIGAGFYQLRYNVSRVGTYPVILYQSNQGGLTGMRWKSGYAFGEPDWSGVDPVPGGGLGEYRSGRWFGFIRADRDGVFEFSACGKLLLNGIEKFKFDLSKLSY